MSDLATTSPAHVTRLNADHEHLARVLDVLERQCRAFQTDTGPDYELLRDILDYVRAYPDTVHHPAEDILFDHLLDNSALSAAERQLVHDNRLQHARLAEATGALLRMVDDVFASGAGGGEALQVKLDEYVADQRRHMHFESRRLFPLAEDRLTEAQWATIERGMSLAEDPLSNARIEQFEILRRHIEACG